MSLSKERANELLAKTITQYVRLADSVSKGTPLNNTQVAADLKMGRKELKELGLNFDNRR